MNRKKCKDSCGIRRERWTQRIGKSGPYFICSVCGRFIGYIREPLKQSLKHRARDERYD